VASTISGPMPSPAINVAGITFSAADCTFGKPFYGRSALLSIACIAQPAYAG
jgi:hypothetical protein